MTRVVEALRADRLAGVALDVLDPEPPSATHPLLALDPRRVILTPHFAAASLEVTAALQAEISDAIRAVFSNRWPVGTINPSVRPKMALS